MLPSVHHENVCENQNKLIHQIKTDKQPSEANNVLNFQGLWHPYRCNYLTRNSGIDVDIGLQHLVITTMV